MNGALVLRAVVTFSAGAAEAVEMDTSTTRIKENAGGARLYF